MSSADQSGRRLPPYSEEAERGVLGSALIESERVLELEGFQALCAESFYIPAHRLLFEQLIAMYQSARPIDLLTVGEHLKQNGHLEKTGGHTFLEGLIDSTPTAAHAEYYIELVRQKHLLRRIIAKAAETIDHCYTEEDAPALLSRTEQEFFELGDQKTASSGDWKEAVKSAMKQIDEPRQFGGVPTGFSGLDKKLRGLHNSDMIVLAARPSMGKTSLAMNIVEHAALGRNAARRKYAVGVFSLEMGQEQLVRRMLFSRARVRGWRGDDERMSQEDHGFLVGAADQLDKAEIFIDDTGGLDIMDLRTRARRMKRLYNVELIVIDYLQLLHDRRNQRDGRQQETASISHSIKEMAKELKLPVLVLSQLSRAPEQREGKPRLSDLRDSGAIEQDADVVLLLQRRSHYKDADAVDPEEDTLALVDVAKHRNGPTGEVEMNFFKEFTRFEDRDTRHGVDGEPPAQ